ncbi:hypothetical protein F5I97DRAFT_521092 [Phlebopus sp. FC_14]|nr:hypothetical protein F5I97DRAFT_521092 [Phlebopus sp. FC_14]
MAEDDGTAKPVSSGMKNGRPAKRRVASAPLPATPEGSAESLITPSPTPSPSNSKKKFERLSSSLKTAFNPTSGRNRPPGNVRTVSVKAPGRYDRYPGEGTLQFYPPPDISRFRKSPQTEEGSQNTAAAEEGTGAV